jgi:osmotically inducible protein OsmC
MATRNASARWTGNLKGGEGTMALGSGAFEGAYSFQSRFEEGTGTNPEELIGAALAGCYSMQLAADLERDGHSPESVDTQGRVHLRIVDDAPTITQIDLVTRARVQGLDDAAFQETVRQAKEHCLVSRALAGVGEINLEATLES